MSSNSDKNILINRFELEIDEIITESEHVYKNTIDYDFIDTRFTLLLKTASGCGVEEKIMWELISKRFPAYINYINANLTRKKIA